MALGDQDWGAFRATEVTSFRSHNSSLNRAGHIDAPIELDSKLHARRGLVRTK